MDELITTVDPDAVYTKTGAAKRLQIGVRTLEDLMASGRLAYYRVGDRLVRISETQIRAYLAGVEQNKPGLTQRGARRRRSA